ncbi:MAG: hypothetical protein ACI9CD_000470 [Candidatus Deianiraeaceae bacterium]|jgi:hypothetical protein
MGRYVTIKSWALSDNQIIFFVGGLKPRADTEGDVMKNATGIMYLNGRNIAQQSKTCDGFSKNNVSFQVYSLSEKQQEIVRQSIAEDAQSTLVQLQTGGGKTFMMCVQDMLYKTGYTNRPATLISPDNTLASKVANDTLLNQNGMYGADMSDETPELLSKMNGKLFLSLRTSKTIQALLNGQQVKLLPSLLKCADVLSERGLNAEGWENFIKAENEALDTILSAINNKHITPNQLKKWFCQQGSLHIIPSFSPNTLLQHMQDLQSVLVDSPMQPYLEQVRVIIEGCFHFDEAHDVDRVTVGEIEQTYNRLKDIYIYIYSSIKRTA